MLENYHHIFIVGIGGSATFNVALILKQMGKRVSGSDAPTITLTDELLKQNGVPFVTSFDPALVPKDTDLVIYSGAHHGKHNAQVVEAQKREIRIMSLSEFNGMLLKQFRTSIAVCGCHGKTTTSSLTAYSLLQLNADPSYLIGTATFNEYFGGGYGKGDVFVIESDEYGVNPPDDKTPKFLSLHPTHCICTNIDFDHPDVYNSIEEVKNAFKTFFEQTVSFHPDAKIIACHDNKHLMDVLSSFPKKNIVTYGFSHEADIHISSFSTTETESHFSLSYLGDPVGDFSISLCGKHSILNAAAVITLLRELKYDANDIAQAIKGFTGSKRRMELVSYINDTYIFDDYAHHPAEIKTTLEGAKERFSKRQVIVLFQPHTYSRTQSLLADFAESLHVADYAYVLPIFASARENAADFYVSSKDIELQAKERGYGNVRAIEEDELNGVLRENVKRGDVVMTMGAGDVYKRKSAIIDVLKTLS